MAKTGPWGRQQTQVTLLSTSQARHLVVVDVAVDVVGAGDVVGVAVFDGAAAAGGLGRLSCPSDPPTGGR